MENWRALYRVPTEGPKPRRRKLRKRETGEANPTKESILQVNPRNCAMGSSTHNGGKIRVKGYKFDANNLPKMVQATEAEGIGGQV